MPKFYKVPNILILVPNPKSTSRQMLVPEYELPLVRMMYEQYLPDPVNNPIRAKKLPAVKPGKRDNFAGSRYRELISVALEKARLAQKYKAHPTTKSNIFDTVYPGFEFERRLNELYPDVFPRFSDRVEEVVEEVAELDDPYDDDLQDIDEEKPQPDFFGSDDEEESEETADPDQDPSKAETAAVGKEAKRAQGKDSSESVSKGAAVPEEALAELSQLKRVEDVRARELYLAGYTSIEEIAQTDPEELAQKISGLGSKTAKEVVEHANELFLEDGLE